MGEELGAVFDALYNDVLWLQTKWVQLQKLFLHSPERTRTLFASAPFFFEVLRGVMWEDCLLHVARLTDKANQGDYNNLSLPCLPSLVMEPKLRSRLQSNVDRAVNDATFARAYRDKYLAHADIGFALDTVDALPPVKVDDVERVLDDFRRIVNVLQRHYFGQPIHIEDVVAFGDAESLIAQLIDAGGPSA
jgi:hypothetical protein